MANVLEWLDKTALRLPDKCAVADPESQLSFSELRTLSHRAGTWVANHAAPRRAVVFFLEKSPRALAAMLGCAAAGDFYCVMDVRQPEGRLESIVGALEPIAIVYDDASQTLAQDRFATSSIPLIALDELLEHQTDEALLKQRQLATIDTDPLYVAFTSGSTGKPKGIVIPHRAVVDFVGAFDEAFSINENDTLGNQAPFDYDASVKDIYSMLRTGATVRLIPRSYFTQPAKLMDYLADNEVTTLVWAVSALCFVSIMNGLEYRVPQTVRKVLFSGEAMPPKQLTVWQKALPDALFANLYGPSEVTCNCTYHVVERIYDKHEIIPMGKPFANERVILLDENDNAIEKPGIEGEICVGGTTLALGYLGDEKRSQAAFVQNPLNTHWREILYRTGDLAHYDENADLVYSSRKDFQIKHLGQRIELGDIESAAQAISGVERACCIYDPRRKRIWLFYLGKSEHEAVVEGLRRTLPQSMVPSHVMQLEEFPLLGSGKINRSALKELAHIKL